MDNYTEAKNYLTLEDAVVYISQELNEQVTSQNLCDLIKDGHLILSVQLTEIVFAKKGIYAPFKQVNYWGWAEHVKNIREHKNINPLDMHQDKGNKRGLVFENDIITIEPGRVLDFPHFRYDAENIFCLFLPKSISIDIHKLPLILKNDECFFKLLSPKGIPKDKIRKAIKKSKEGVIENELPNFVAINSKNFALDLVKFAEGIADPYEIEKRFFLKHSRLHDLEHRILFKRENLDKYIREELKKRKRKEFNPQYKQSCLNLIKLLSFELNQNFDEKYYLKIEDKKSCYIIIDSLLDSINKLNKLNQLNNHGYLRRALAPNKKVNAILLADAAAASADVDISQATIYAILKDIKLQM